MGHVDTRLGLWASRAAGVVALLAGLTPAPARSAPDSAASIYSACRPVAAAEGVDAAILAGPEDLAYDPLSGGLFIAAFDRRAVARAHRRAEPPPHGALGLATRVAGAWRVLGVVTAADIEGLEQFRPHGIALSPEGADRRLLAVVNRRYAGRRRDTSIEMFDLDDDAARHLATLEHPALCRANDLTFVGPNQLLVTLDHGACADWAAALEDVFNLRRGGLVSVSVDANGGLAAPPRLAASGIGFANGVVWSAADDGAWVAATREKRLRFFSREALFGEPGAGAEAALSLPGHPDNITLDRGDMLVALHPSLLRLARHRRDPAVEAGTSVVRIGADGVRRVLNDPAGAAIPAATTALSVDGDLLLGSATAAGPVACPPEQP